MLWNCGVSKLVQNNFRMHCYWKWNLCLVDSSFHSFFNWNHIQNEVKQFLKTVLGIYFSQLRPYINSCAELTVWQSQTPCVRAWDYSLTMVTHEITDPFHFPYKGYKTQLACSLLLAHCCPVIRFDLTQTYLIHSTTFICTIRDWFCSIGHAPRVYQTRDSCSITYGLAHVRPAHFLPELLVAQLTVYAGSHFTGPCDLWTTWN